MSNLDADLFNLAMSDKARPLMDAVKQHIKENVEPIIEEFFALNKDKTDRWSWHPRQLELLDGAKARAKESGLWNFFLPESELGDGLTNLDYEMCIRDSPAFGAGPWFGVQDQRRACARRSRDGSRRCGNACCADAAHQAWWPHRGGGR